MISRPLGLCPICNDGKQKILINKVCQYHYWAAARQRSKPITRSVPLHKASSPAKAPELWWYEDKLKMMTGNCWECKTHIPLYIRHVAISAVAHIFPKEIFPSIKFHPWN